VVGGAVVVVCVVVVGGATVGVVCVVGAVAGAVGTETVSSSPPHAPRASAAETATAPMRSLLRSIHFTVATAARRRAR
jgi:hypothetical protein